MVDPPSDPSSTSTSPLATNESRGNMKPPALSVRLRGCRCHCCKSNLAVTPVRDTADTTMMQHPRITLARGVVRPPKPRPPGSNCAALKWDLDTRGHELDCRGPLPPPSRPPPLSTYLIRFARTQRPQPNSCVRWILGSLCSTSEPRAGKSVPAAAAYRTLPAKSRNLWQGVSP